MGCDMKISYKVLWLGLLLASLSFAETESAKDSVLDNSKKKFVEDLSKGCDKMACAREFTFENGYYQKMEKGRSNLARERLIADISAAGQRTAAFTPAIIKERQDELDGLMMQRSVLASSKMSPECASDCEACVAPADSAKTETVAAADSIKDSVPATVAVTDSSNAALAAIASDSTVAAAQVPADSASQVPAAVSSDSSVVAAADSLATDSTAAVPAAVVSGDSSAAAQVPADSVALVAAVPDTVVTAVDSAAVSQTPATALAVASADSVTPVDSAAFAARTDSIARADSLFKVSCLRTDAICRCTEFSENARRLVELDSVIALKRKESDSLANARPAIVRASQAMAIADTIHTLCAGSGKCTFSVTFTSDELSMIELRKVEESIALPVQTPVQAPAATSVVEAVPQVQPENCVQPSVDSSAVQSTESPSDKESAPDSSKKDGERIFYKAMEITFAQLTESDYFLKNHGRFPFDEKKAIEGRIAYLLRWYFYDAGAISVGMGTTYRYNKLEKYELVNGWNSGYQIEYHSLALDAPISVRLGVPKIPFVRPFVSETFMFSKPIYEFALAKSDVVLGDEKPKKINSIFNASKDWEYSVWLGFGLELTRYFSLEYQLMLGSKKNGHAHIYDTDDSWRVVVGFAW